MHLDIITPEKKVQDGEFDELYVPTEKGQIGILPRHINLVSQITPGEIKIKTQGKEKILAITGGFLEVNKDQVTILADYAEHIADIDADKAREAQKRAEEVLSKRHEITNQQDIIRAEAELRRSLLQQHISQRHRRKHQ